MVEVFMREMFNDFPRFVQFFVISITNPLILDEEDFACCCVISEMQHALDKRLPFYKWSYKYLLKGCDRMAMMKAMPLKVGC